jgi:hypothetical protein
MIHAIRPSKQYEWTILAHNSETYNDPLKGDHFAELLGLAQETRVPIQEN